MQIIILYALGTLGSDEKLNDSLKPVIEKSLADNLKNTKDTQTQVATLQAIGNYGGSDILDQVLPFFSSDSEQVRVAANESIRRMDPGKAFDTFVDSYSAESSQNVRTSALKILESMKATGETVSWAGKEGLAVDESADQESLAKVLGKNIKTYPEAEEPLRKLLAKKPSNNVKKTVYRYIVPK
jgi:HEAT repeat protein